jgi:SAM-dependent methyltransferase
MSSTSVSILMPLIEKTESAGAPDEIRRYLETTGFAFEVLPLENRSGEQYGALIRRGTSDARGDVIVVVDAALGYPVSAIGDAVAMIQSGSTDIVFGTTGEDATDGAAFAFLRWMLVPTLPDPTVRLMAFSSLAARLAIGETRLQGRACDLEIAFLANKYGFRVERLHVESRGARPAKAFSPLSLGVAFSIRLANRRMAYRPARRCPVCFSNDVSTIAQIPDNVIRACWRCKCRYLNQFAEGDETQPVRRILRPHLPPAEPREEIHSKNAREKTSARRLAAVRRHLAPRARILEVGVRDGSFGAAVSREFEYVGIDHSPAVMRAARSRGLDVYCAALGNFVNTGPAFDAVALYHVFGNMADPHDTLARIKDLLKPGGVLFITTLDTEGLLYMFTERARMRQNFRTQLILYSRSAMIELLEHSGFEIEVIGPEFDYRDHRLLRHWLTTKWPRLGATAALLLKFLPDPLIVSSGSIRIIAKRRAGAPMDVRAIRSVEATHAR